jgi:hypothetical protein
MPLINNNKRILTVILIILSVCCLLFCILPQTVHAGEDKNKQDNKECPICSTPSKKVYHDVTSLGATQKAVYDMQVVIFGGGAVDGLLGDVLRFDTTSPTFQDMWNDVARGYYDILARFGEILCVVYMLIALMGMSLDDMLTPEHFFKHMIKLIIGVILIRTGFDVVDAVMSLGIIVFSGLEDATAAGAGGSCVYNTVAKLGFFEAIGDMFTLITPWIVMGFATIILHVVCWARVLDIMTRVIFAPIGMADLMLDGTRSNGFKYLKKMLSSALQGTVLLATLRGYGIIVMALKETQGSLPVTILMVVTYSMIAMLFKAKPIADDLVGL